MTEMRLLIQRHSFTALNSELKQRLAVTARGEVEYVVTFVKRFFILVLGGLCFPQGIAVLERTRGE